MGPIRGLKRKKKPDTQVIFDDNAPISTQNYSSDWWEHFSERISGSLLKSKDPPIFELIFKISRMTFKYICSLVKEEMMAKPSNFSDLDGRLLCLNDRVAVALRRLSSGDSLSAVGNSFGINQTTVGHLTWRFVEAMEKRGLHHLYWPSEGEEIKRVKSKFEKIRGLPNCCGVIDTTHIGMCLSTSDKSNDIWLDREKNYSMILQAIVDPRMRFLDIVTGWPGSLTGSTVLTSSTFFKLVKKGKRLNGEKTNLSEASLEELPEYIIGDKGYPLLPWLLTPHSGKNLPSFKEDFNKRHYATRCVAQRALAKLKDTWRIIDGTMWFPDKNRLPRVILVCCILHNILIDLEDKVQDDIPLTCLHDSDDRHETCNLIDESAWVLREKLSHCLSGEKLSHYLSGV